MEEAGQNKTVEQKQKGSLSTCLLYTSLSLPVERQIMEVLFREMMLSSISGWITMWVDPMIYVKMTAIGITAYAVVAVLEFRRIRHVPMDEALKNVE